jgi:hypothetical protein
MHGSGKTTWVNGKLYQGDYVNDLKHGNGTFLWPDSRSYIGEWQYGK